MAVDCTGMPMAWTGIRSTLMQEGLKSGSEQPLFISDDHIFTFKPLASRSQWPPGLKA